MIGLPCSALAMLSCREILYLNLSSRKTLLDWKKEVSLSPPFASPSNQKLAQKAKELRISS